MFRRSLISALILLGGTQAFGQYDQAYKKKFDDLRRHLGGGETGEAFILLQDLYALDSLNHYTNYLIGICYTEQEIVTKESVKHLEYACENVMEIYTYIPFTEKRSPVYAWYYLTKAYSQNGQCKKAKIAMKKFHNAYGYQNKDFFITNVEKFMIECGDRSWALKHKGKESVVTKEVNYTTDNPLYGVQVGAFKELVPVREQFNNLKNVEAFMDKSSTLRYVVGHFGYRKQAESLLKVIKNKGYEDAFIVNVNKEKRFSREIVIVDNVSFKANIMGNIEYRVQIGAFQSTDSIPPSLARKYLEIDNLAELPEGVLTIITAGKFTSYDRAGELKNQLIKLGVPGAFVIALNQGHKISLNAAKKYIDRKGAEKAEPEKKISSKKKKKKP